MYSLFLPVEHWGSSVKSLLKNPKILAAVTASLGPGIFAGPLLIPFLSPILTMVVGIIVVHLYKEQKCKKIKAIQETWPGKYSDEDLEQLYENDREEFNRLFKLASDRFFREYIKEQSDHKKAQELIIKMQERINAMQDKLETLMKKESKHRDEIEQLKEDIRVYEDISNSWGRVMTAHG